MRTPRFSVFKEYKKRNWPPKMKKLPSKVAQNRPPPFFLCTVPDAQTAQKQKTFTTKSPLMQDWVFRLGSNPLCPSLSLLSFRVPSFLHYFWFNNATADAASITLAQTSWKLLANLIRFVHYDTSLLGSYWCIFPFSLEIQRKMKWNIHDIHDIFRVCVM